ncbi:MAG: hypothetical protein WC814_02670 [Candidatus Paceibacterota bacterium]
MNESQSLASNRHLFINTLAVVGFVALIGASMWLAVYSTRYVPDVAGRIGSAAVYLGSVFTPADEPTLSVVPTPVASTTIPFGEEGSSTEVSTTSPTAPAETKTAPTAGKKTGGTYQIGGALATGVLSGLPDFVVTINAVGYLASNSAESFVATSTVPADSRPAVKFTIKNIGTNVSGPWRWSASIPTQTAYLYQSQTQQTLGPGDSIDYTLGFDQSNKGVDQMISITANFDRTVAESSTDNNSASAKVTVLGS